MTDTPTEDVIAAMVAAGLKADYAYTPSEISVAVDGAELLLTRHFNVAEAWEAAVDMPGRDQYGVEDGPAPDAPAADVVAWVQRLIAEGLKPA